MIVGIVIERSAADLLNARTEEIAPAAASVAANEHSNAMHERGSALEGQRHSLVAASTLGFACVTSPARAEWQRAKAPRHNDPSTETGQRAYFKRRSIGSAQPLTDQKRMFRRGY